MFCGHCDSDEHESHQCPSVNTIQRSERAAERLHRNSDPEALEEWLTT